MVPRCGRCSAAAVAPSPLVWPPPTPAVLRDRRDICEELGSHFVELSVWQQQLSLLEVNYFFNAMRLPPGSYAVLPHGIRYA